MGTTFDIYLPIVLCEYDEPVKTELTQLVGGSETILVGEDDEDIRKFIRETLECYGYTVIEAVDGEDVVQKFKENEDRIELLVLDVIMPKKSGKAAYDEIMNSGRHIGALFLSGYNSDFIERQVTVDEKMNLLQKPVGVNALLNRVRSALDVKQPREP